MLSEGNRNVTDSTISTRSFKSSKASNIPLSIDYTRRWRRSRAGRCTSISD